MREDYDLIVRPFKMGTDKEAALKPLEEAAEAFSAWQEYDRWLKLSSDPRYSEEERTILADEVADAIQAACNLAARYDLDLSAAMERCEHRNRDRGRYPKLGVDDE